MRNTAAMFIARESAGADAYIPVYMSVHGSIVIDIVTFICLISNNSKEMMLLLLGTFSIFVLVNDP